MARQVLTFVIIFFGVMFAMRSCAPQEGGPASEEVERPDDVFALEQGDLTVRLTKDGTIYMVERAGATLVRPVSAWRRPLQLTIEDKSERLLFIPRDVWQSEKLTDGAYRFTHTAEGMTFDKVVRLLPDGSGLDVELKVTNVAKEVRSFLLTLLAGVPLTGVDAEDESRTFWQREGGGPVFRTLSGLTEARQRQGSDIRHADKADLAPGDTVQLFGVQGQAHFLAAEALPNLYDLYLDVYRLKRDDATSTEIEGWVTLIPRNGEYEGTFRLRWGERAALETRAGFERTKSEDSKEYVLEDETYRVVFTDRGAAIREMWLKKYSEVAGEEPAEGNWVPILRRGTKVGERALTLRVPDEYGVNPARAVWKAERIREGRALRFELEIRGWRFVKTVALPDGGRFELDVSVEIQPPAGFKEKHVDYTLVGPAGSYIADSYRGIIGATLPAGMILQRDGNEEERDINGLAGSDDK